MPILSIRLPMDIHNRVLLIKTVRNWHRLDKSDQWNRIGSSETGSYTYENVAYGKGHKS